MDIFIKTALAQVDKTEEINTFMGMGYDVSEIINGLGWFWTFLVWFFWIGSFALVILGTMILVKHFTKEKEEKIETYICPLCGYEYKEKEWAAKCQRWCQEYKSCNLDIIKHGSPKEL